MDTATGVPALFALFVGTTSSFHYPESYIPAVPPKAFSDHSQQPEGCQEISTHDVTAVSVQLEAKVIG